MSCLTTDIFLLGYRIYINALVVPCLGVCIFVITKIYPNMAHMAALVVVGSL